MKAKEIQSELGGLLDATGTIGDYNSSGYENSIPAELADDEPVFEFNHEGSLNSGSKKAQIYLKKIVDAIVPAVYQKNPIIQDKIEQDTEQLGQLFYQQDTNNVMLKAAMDVVSKGDTQPRMFEVYTKLMLASSELSKQITELLNQFRKYYIDTYLDMKNKEDEDMLEDESEKVKTLAGKPQQHTLTNEEDTSNRFNSTRDMVLSIHESKKEKFKQRFQQETQKEG